MHIQNKMKGEQLFITPDMLQIKGWSILSLDEGSEGDRRDRGGRYKYDD